MSKVTEQSYVTLASNDNYAIGALTLAHSLKKVNTDRQLTVLITNGVSNSVVENLKCIFDHVIEVDVLNSNDAANLALLKRPELGVTFTKLHCWRLEQFSKCVFLDADCLVLKNVDDLFDREEFSAVTDVGWPDCFNSGVFVFRPSLETYSKILNFALEIGSFDGGDQGLLNSFFSNWSTSDASRRLPFIYNMTTNVSYSYAPAYKHFSETVKIVHFIGAQKPWYYSYNQESNTVIGNLSNHETRHLNEWWSSFIQNVYPSLDYDTKSRVQIKEKKTESHSENNYVSSTNVQTNYNESPQETTVTYQTGDLSSGGVIVGSNEHQNLWEQGQIEYQGRDAFSNIAAHLDAQLKIKEVSNAKETTSKTDKDE